MATAAREPRPPRPWPTLGGVQLASDVFWHAGWRIQRLALGGRHRLLDPLQRLRASGSREVCRSVFEEVRRTEGLPPGGHVVVLLHGLGRTRRSLATLARALVAAGLEPAALSVASTRTGLERQVEDLFGLLSELEARRVSFVTHSLGGILLRAVLGHAAAFQGRFELGRAVLIAPPNQGSALSRRLASSPPVRLPFGLVLGAAGRQLGLAGRDLPAPACPFALVAGARGTPRGWNPLLEGDDDGVVSVDETRLAGAADHLVVRGLHTFLMSDPRVVEACLRFLLEGRLRAGAPVTDPTWPPAGSGSGIRAEGAWGGS